MSRTDYGSGQGLCEWTRPTLKANRLGDLDSLAGYGIDQLNSMIIDPRTLEEFETKSGESTKSTYSSETFVGVSLAIKPAI